MNDRVLLETLDKRYYVGEIKAFHSDIGKIEIRFYTGLNADKSGKIELLDIGTAEKCLYNIPDIRNEDLSVGTIVWFVLPNLKLQIGRVKSSNTTGICSIEWYDVTSDGRIHPHSDDAVKLESVTSIAKKNNILPVSVGDKIEYAEEKDGTLVKGEVTYINSDDTVDITYKSIDGWEEDGISIPLSDIRVIFNAREKLDRSLFINDNRQKDIDVNEGIKKRIKEDDDFSDATGIVQSNRLYRHQRAGTLLANMYDKFAFFYDTGTGKTVMALDIISSKEKKDNARFLIIAPKSIIKTAWLDDAANYYPRLRILPLYKGFDARKKRALLNRWKSGGKSSYLEYDSVFYAHVKLFCDMYELEDIQIDDDTKVNKELEDGAQHYIINSELFIRSPIDYIERLGITGIVMDESAILKNYNGKTSKTMRELSSKVKYLYLLSGKPAPNNVVEYFSQMKVVDSETFPMSYNNFLSSFCYQSNGKYCMSSDNEKLFADMVAVKSLIISKKDCLDLPETVDIIRLIELSPSIMSDYNDLYRECMAIIKGMDDSEIYYSTPSRLAILMKLRQMASGFFMTGDEGHRESKIIVDIHNAKLRELNNVIDQIEVTAQ